MTTRLSHDAYIDAFEESAAGVQQLAAELDPQTPVPSCPDWGVGDLVAHLGGVHGWACNVLTGGNPRDPRPTPDGPLAQWYGSQAAQLTEALRTVDPAAATWTIAGPDRTAGFWARRQAHETEMHRLDAVLAAGHQAAYSPQLAPDAVTEIFDVMVPRMNRDTAVDVSGPILLSADDGVHSWMLRAAETALAYEYQPAETDDATVSVDASAADLVAGLWRRAPYTAWSVTGDQAALDRLMSSKLTP